MPRLQTDGRVVFPTLSHADLLGRSSRLIICSVFKARRIVARFKQSASSHLRLGTRAAWFTFGASLRHDPALARNRAAWVCAYGSETAATFNTIKHRALLPNRPSPATADPDGLRQC